LQLPLFPCHYDVHISNRVLQGWDRCDFPPKFHWLPFALCLMLIDVCTALRIVPFACFGLLLVEVFQMVMA
jgi:hypothetical protein